MNGVDLEASYRFDARRRHARLRPGLHARCSTSSAWRSGRVGDLVTRDLTGEYEYPEDRATLRAIGASDKWGLHASVNYIGAFQDLPDSNFDTVPDYELDQRDVGAFMTLNLQGRYNFTDDIKVLLSVDNAFDEAPPFAVGDGNNDLYGYVSSQHDPRGRFAYAKVTYAF